MLLIYLILLGAALLLGVRALAAHARGWRPTPEPRPLERLAVVGALIAAVASTLRLLLVPSISTSATSFGPGVPPATIERELTVLGAGDWAIVPVLLVFLALASAPLLIRRRSGRYWAEFASAVLLAGMTIAGGFSIGPFLLPSAALMLLAVLFGGPLGERLAVR